MIENNGDTTESKLVAVTNDQRGPEFTGWQRSTADDFSFYISSAGTVLLQWQVIDIAGRIINKGSKRLYSGLNSLQVNMAGTGRGIYYFKLSYAGEAGQMVHPFAR